MKEELPLDQISSSLAALIEVIGWTAAIRLMETHGGREIWVPVNAHDDFAGEARRTGLWAIVGREALEALVKRFGGQEIYIPQERQYAVAVRDRRIWELRQEGKTISTLATEFGLTERWIWAIVRKQRHLASRQNKKAEPPTIRVIQGELF